MHTATLSDGATVKVSAPMDAPPLAFYVDPEARKRHHPDTTRVIHKGRQSSALRPPNTSRYVIYILR